MKIKEQFELVYGTDGSVYNVLPISRNTASAYEVDKEDFFHLKMLASTYARSKGSGDFVVKNIDNCLVTRIPTYPLPGFVSKDGYPGINISVLPSMYVSDFVAADVYAMFTYSLLLKSFISNDIFEKNIDEPITEYLISVFVSMFGKKHGLLGSYSRLLPNLKALIALYVNVGMLGRPLDKFLISRISSKYYIDVNEIRLKYDISTTVGFLKCIKDNNIIPISENSFSTTVINLSGISGLCMFEDTSRFFATILASNVAGTNLFSKYWRKTNRKLFEKILDIGVKNLKRTM